MLSGSNVTHGHVYQLNCGYGYVEAVLGNDERPDKRGQPARPTQKLLLVDLWLPS